MYRYWKHRKNSYHCRPPKRLTKEEKLQWMLFLAVFAFAFIFYFVSSFISNCIFEWPIRWDIHTCWDEQKNPAKEKAFEKAADFIP